MTVSVVGQVGVRVVAGGGVLDDGAHTVHVSAQVVRDEDDQRVLLLQPVDHLPIGRQTVDSKNQHLCRSADFESLILRTSAKVKC